MGKAWAMASRTGHGARVRLTWPQVHAWRLQRQFDGAGPVDVVRRLCGVQAQVLSAAEQAVAVRLGTTPSGLSAAMDDGLLLRTWAMRGTLHVLHPQEAAAALALVSTARTWTKGSWQKTFLSASDLDRLTAAVVDLLADGRPHTREELVAHVTNTAGAEVAGHVASSWGAALKPLAWQGFLCNGPSLGTRVTFTRPQDVVADWTGLPDVDEAAARLIPAYLAAFGPASPATFDAWLVRGATSKPMLQQWFSDLGEQVTPVDVEGVALVARAEDVNALATTTASDVVRLLPAFDQFVLGPGTTDGHLVPAQHRADVSRTGGWISPVVATCHGVVGTWTADAGRIAVQLFDDAPVPAAPTLEAEIVRVEGLLAA
jgi:hypothetical protein